MKKILILASIWCQNLGDELILKNEIKYLEKKYWKCAFIISTYDKKDIFYKKKCMKFIEYFPLGIKSPKNIFRNIRNLYHLIRSILWSDEVVFWGWWIFYDSEVQLWNSPLPSWAFRAFLVKLLRKDLHILWTSISIKNNENLKYIKKIFWNAKEIKVRDSESQKLLSNLEIESQIMPDFVFNDSVEIAEHKKITKYEKAESVKVKDFDLLNFKGKTMGLALRQGFIKNEDNFIKSLIKKIENDWWKVILIPHSFHKTDPVSNDFDFLKKFSSEKVRITNNLKESHKIYTDKEIDMLIWMRLHSIILAYTYWISCVPISYSDKTDSIIKTLT